MRWRGPVHAGFAFIAAFPFSTCDSWSRKIDGPYKVLAIDTLDSMTVSYDLGRGSSIERVPCKVVRVGFDDRYIVVAREPHTDMSCQSISGAALEYFYIDRAEDDGFGDDAVEGPFDAEAFARETDRLALPPLSRDVP